MIERRGELWTARQAEHELGLAPRTVQTWRDRGHIEPALDARPALYWSDDLYDCQHARRMCRRSTATRDNRTTAV